MKKKKVFKMASEELAEFLSFQRKGSMTPAKKGKGSYRRKKRVDLDKEP